MGKATTFLLRWLYVTNLIEDRIELFNLSPLLQQQLQADIIPTQQQQQQQGGTIPPPPPPPPYESQQAQIRQTSAIGTNKPTTTLHQSDEEKWRRQAFHSITSHPPGTPRLVALDALRLEIIRDLDHSVSDADDVLRRHFRHEKQQLTTTTTTTTTRKKSSSMGLSFSDGDPDILSALRELTGGKTITALKHPTTTSSLPSQQSSPPPPSPSSLSTSLSLRREIREYLPQLVATVLHSPGRLTSGFTGIADPIESLRRLLLTLCLDDPDAGIELCWLLEAEVGRAWKTLFEHRQQTGRRLIVVLPAEKALVLAKIGTEKKVAFDLLQDIEQATAYGTLVTSHHHHHHHHQYSSIRPTLPPSLSLKRCHHFGDTMHFVDSLSTLSRDLRDVVPSRREWVLKRRLEELNRRLRRRMVTRGAVSLDVEEDGVEEGEEEGRWPTIEDVTLEMVRYSVHFPMEPKCDSWPGGGSSTTTTATKSSPKPRGVMRVLNILPSECRLLASRDRCPFLVQLEVAETDYSGSDARLYAVGHDDVGVTMGDIVSLLEGEEGGEGRKRGMIPEELWGDAGGEGREEDAGEGDDDVKSVRGGYQYPGDNEEGFPPYEETPFDQLRQMEYEMLHRQMMHDRYMQQQQQQQHYHQYQQPQSYHQPPPPSPPTTQSTSKPPPLSTGTTLLNRIYGPPHSQKCSHIRSLSPYGSLPQWRLASFILKAGEDIRLEALVMQVISRLNHYFQKELPPRLRPYLRPYTIMCVGSDAGLLECVTDAKSVDEIKKTTDGFTSLKDYFERAYGSGNDAATTTTDESTTTTTTTPSLPTARRNFLRSLVGYSLVCYILQIKDRHNANILLDRHGRILHIDFGFVLGDVPKMGRVPLFSERAPFKLTAEFWEVIGGWDYDESGGGLLGAVEFCRMLEACFRCASRHREEIASLIRLGLRNVKGEREARVLAEGVERRLRLRGEGGESEQKEFIVELVNAALTSLGTSTYDWLQKSMNGYQ